MKDYSLACKSGLLHDIGKPCQRATNERKTHSLIGAEFLEKFADGTEAYRQIIRCVKYHHASDLKSAHLREDDLAYIVYEADNISAGADRRDVISGENTYRDFDREMCLENIFNIFRHQSEEKKSYYHLKELNAQNCGKDIDYPIRTKVFGTEGAYASVVDYLAANFRRRNPKEMKINELLRVLEDLIIYVPSSTNKEEVCDISLYDHVKMTGGIAGAILRWCDLHGITNYKEVCYAHNSKYREKPLFLLVEGDFSGIQKFIYKVPNKGAMRMLRGKSFYLQIMMENIIDEILSALGLSRANLIYSGGGHFYMLVDNSEETIQILKTAFAKVNEYAVKKHGTQLYLAGAWEEVSANEMMGKRDADVKESMFMRVNHKIAIAKEQRYGGLIRELCDEKSDFNKTLPNSRECSICHVSVLGDTLVKYKAERGEGVTEVCRTCQGLYILGEVLLQRNSCFVISPEPLGGDSLPLPGIEKELWCTGIDKRKGESLEKAKIFRIYAKNDSTTSEYISSRLWVADYAATSSGRVLDFSELAELVGGSEESQGIYRLGVLRADVDWLGLAFIAGFTGTYGTLSRYATLSRNLSMFFSRFINKVATKQLPEAIAPFHLFADKGKEVYRNIHIVYAGGDDLFVVGAWDDLLEFAVDLRHTFSLYTNNKLSFSAGLGLFSPAFPILRMAEETGKMEEIAKNVDKKNSIILFGREQETVQGMGEKALCCTWDELEDIKRNQLTFLLSHFVFSGINDREDGGEHKLEGTKTLLYKILLLLREKKFNLAKFAYLLARMEPVGVVTAEEEKCYKEVKDYFYRQLRDTTEKRKQMEVALSFILYRMRDK